MLTEEIRKHCEELKKLDATVLEHLKSRLDAVLKLQSAMLKKIDELEGENNMLRRELGAARAKLER